MVSKEIIELGKKALAKKQRKEARDANFTPAAQFFVDLLQKALDTGKACSIVAWAHEGSADGRIFGTTRYNPISRSMDICNETLGLERMWDLPGDEQPSLISASFSRFNKSRHSFQVWPYVGTWEAVIINRLVKAQITPPAGISLAVHFMDVRGVSGARLQG